MTWAWRASEVEAPRTGKKRKTKTKTPARTRDPTREQPPGWARRPQSPPFQGGRNGFRPVDRVGPIPFSLLVSSPQSLAASSTPTKRYPPVLCQKVACSPFDIGVVLWICGPLLLLSDSSLRSAGAPTTVPIRLFLVVAAGLDPACLIIVVPTRILLGCPPTNTCKRTVRAPCTHKRVPSHRFGIHAAVHHPERRMYHPPVGVSSSHYWDRSPRGQQPTCFRGRFWKDRWGFRVFSNFPSFLPCFPVGITAASSLQLRQSQPSRALLGAGQTTHDPPKSK